MNDQPDPRLVDAHAEGARRHDHVEPVVEEGLERPASPLAREAGVVRRRAVSCLGQGPGDGLGDAPGGRVHDHHPVVVGEQAHERLQSGPLARDRNDAEPEVGAIEGAEVLVVAAGQKTERAGDVAADFGRGAARQGNRRRPAEPVTRGAERPVTRPEVVPPLGDAVGLVNGEQRGANRAHLELRREAREPLRGDVQQPERPVAQALPEALPLALAHPTVQCRRGNTAGHRSGDLVLHERDERGDDQREPAGDERRNLEADGLSTTGGEHRQRVPSGEHGSDDRALGGPEVTMSEVVAEKATGLVHRVGHGTR